MTTDHLANFTDRYTMRYERTYPHPIERVWAAVTVPEQMDRWMLPFNTVEPRVGGAFGMTFGGPADQPMSGVVSAWEPPRLVQYQFGPGNDSFMRFELTEGEGGTHLSFVHGFPPGVGGTAIAGDPGGDLPGGPDTPWRPGFVAGFHLQMGNLAEFLVDPEATAARVRDSLERQKAGEHASEWLDLIAVYREHIIDTIPGGVSEPPPSSPATTHIS